MTKELLWSGATRAARAGPVARARVGYWPSATSCARLLTWTGLPHPSKSFPSKPLVRFVDSGTNINRLHRPPSRPAGGSGDEIYNKCRLANTSRQTRQTSSGRLPLLRSIELDDPVRWLLMEEPLTSRESAEKPSE